MIRRKVIAPREGEFVLSVVFEVNCERYTYFQTAFLGHKGRGQCALMRREHAIILKFQSGATGREQRKNSNTFLA